MKGKYVQCWETIKKVDYCIDKWCIKHIRWFVGVAVFDVVFGTLLLYLRHRYNIK